jgi:hypothetical protein
MYQIQLLFVVENDKKSLVAGKLKTLEESVVVAYYNT